MIESIYFNSYKKLKDITIPFSNGINIIAGNNGTCKSSILHVISNSFQKTNSKSELLSDNKCLTIIGQLNKHVVPKVETLNRLSKSDNDPSNGQSGSIYEVNFSNDITQNFRKHASSKYHRYSVKLKYAANKKEKLKESMVIYLSLDRLYPFGEFDKDENIKETINKLPEKYIDHIQIDFKKFTGHSINIKSIQKMDFIKNRFQFSTLENNIDSNTVSSGEDNLLMMMIAIYSLVYFCDCLKEDKKDTPVYLLIDEYEASLHPEFQIKFLDLIATIRKKHSNLNLVATSHSLTTIEKAIKEKYNVIYLQNRGDRVELMTSPDLKKIKSNLYSQLHSDLYRDIKIPIITEDAEARMLLERLLQYRRKEESYFKVLSHLDLVVASFSCETIKALFSSKSIPRKNFPSIGIVDGDTTLGYNAMNNCTLALPGKDSPEKIIYRICRELKDDHSERAKEFWEIVDYEIGFNYDILTRDIIPLFEVLDEKIATLKENNKSTHGVFREDSKDIFKNYSHVFEKIFDFWIYDEKNKTEIESFFNNLKIAYYKVCDYHTLPKSLWPKE